MSKRNGFEVIEHAKYLQRMAVCRRLGVSTKLFENKKFEESIVAGESAMQSIDEPTGVQFGSQDPGLAKKGGNSHKESGMLEEEEELEESVQDTNRGSIQAMQSIDDTTGVQVGSQDPGLARKGGNSHKESGMLEEEEELEEGAPLGVSGPNPQERERSAQKRHPGSKSSAKHTGNDPGGRQGVRKSTSLNTNPSNFSRNKLEETEELEEMTVYGDAAKQEVGHDAKQGSQQATQSIDDTTGVQAGSQDPGLRKKGGNAHKEAGIQEGFLDNDPDIHGIDSAETWEETKAALEGAVRFYSGRSGRINAQLAQQMKSALQMHMQTQGEAPSLNEAVDKLVKSLKTLRKSRKK